MLKNCYIGIEGYLTVKLVCVNSNPWLLCCYTGSTSPKSTGHTFGGHCDNVVNAPIWGQRLIWRWGGHTFWKCHWRGSMMLCLVQRFCLYHGLGVYSKSDYLVVTPYDYQQLPTTTNDYQWPPMTTNYYQWLPMTTNDYQYDYILAIFWLLLTRF